MKEFCTVRNNEIILLSAESDECVVFDSFGKYLAKMSYREGLARVGITGIEPVKLCSISGKSLVSASTDLYYGGMRTGIGVPHSALFREVLKSCSKGLKVTTPCRMVGVDGVSIVLLVFKDSYSLESFGKDLQILGNPLWVEV